MDKQDVKNSICSTFCEKMRSEATCKKCKVFYLPMDKPVRELFKERKVTK